jgi:hypothetical protein
MAERNQKDWRELCIAVIHENDSARLSSLIQELIEALDEGKQSWHPRTDSFEGSRAAAC